MTIFNRIINTLHTNEKPLDVVDLAGLLNEDANNIGAALLELKRAGRVHENHRHRWRLTNEERTRLKEEVLAATKRRADPDKPSCPCGSDNFTVCFLGTHFTCNQCGLVYWRRHDGFDLADGHLAPSVEDPTVAKPEVPQDGIHEAVDSSEKLTAVLRTAFQPKCRHCTDWKRLLPDTTNDPEGGWCEKFSDYRAHYESHECHSDLPLEPTNAELDAIEAEESESSTPIGFAGATVELLSDSDADAMAAQWDVECAAKDRPTNGLRIEAVARELVEVESRRQELLKELGRLVSGS